jgi:hypothetical protein
MLRTARDVVEGGGPEGGLALDLVDADDDGADADDATSLALRRTSLSVYAIRPSRDAIIPPMLGAHIGRQGNQMEPMKRRTARERLTGAYWALVGMLGLGTPITDRRAMYGSDPSNDPYSIHFEPDRPKHS